ncbi:helix-turn-helix domain-containing protein [Streptomyces sp. NPDC055808]|uniref:helix-turn-helix domain-containing protein n=1 Tax=Streptomyces sp. NPDC001828 TaxID=3364615 RepID=UPI0036CC452C
MGRRENPVDFTVRRRGDLAALLRQHRETAGFTYQQLAALTRLSAATLKRAASGRTVPSQSTVEAVITACGGNTDDHAAALQLWRQARIEERRGHRPARRAPHPELIASRAELSLGLVRLHDLAGSPSLRAMQQRAGAQWLAISSASRILRRQTLPATEGQMEGFLRACLVPERSRASWLEAWCRVMYPPSSRRWLPSHAAWSWRYRNDPRFREFPDSHEAPPEPPGTEAMRGAWTAGRDREGVTVSVDPAWPTRGQAEMVHAAGPDTSFV